MWCCQAWEDLWKGELGSAGGLFQEYSGKVRPHRMSGNESSDPGAEELRDGN